MVWGCPDAMAEAVQPPRIRTLRAERVPVVSGAWCNEPGRELELLIAAILVGVIAAFVVLLFRGRQMARWNLRDSPVGPSTTATLWAVALCAAVPAVLVSFSVYAAEPCAPDQKTANILYLWAGVLVGVALCLGGLGMANRRHVRGGR